MADASAYVRPAERDFRFYQQEERRRVLRKLVGEGPVPLVVRHPGDEARIRRYQDSYVEAAAGLGLELIWTQVEHAGRPCLGLEVRAGSSPRADDSESILY